MGEAARRWTQALDGWAIPQHILDAAPESPWGFPTALFKRKPGQLTTDTPSQRRALEALPRHGSVLDVGVGAGAGSLPLHAGAGLITGVDEGERMLAEFASSADELGLAHHEVAGRWPDVAPAVEPADVVVCHHVFYNVPELEPFVIELTAHARQRVVVELTAIHPLVRLNPLWRHFHDLERPEGPAAQDALDVLEELNVPARLELWQRQPRPPQDRAELIAFVRRRLCLPSERDQEIDELLGDDPVISPREVATLWWEARPASAA